MKYRWFAWLSMGAVALVVLLHIGKAETAEPGAGADNIQTLKRQGEAFAEIVKKVSPAVVFVKVEKTVEMRMSPQPFFEPGDPFSDDFFERFFRRRPGPEWRNTPPRRFFQEGQGSGFIITPDGYVLTNNHVVGDADKIQVKLADGREFAAKRIGTDPQSDVAVIKIDATNLPTMALGDSDRLNVGEWVLAIGNPFGLSHTVTAGIISAKGRNRVGLADYEDFLQTDAAINPGNSGGPLINLDGEAVGINTAIFSRTGGSMGIGFAIPINMAKAIYEQIVKNGSVIRGYLGIFIQDLTQELAESFGVRDLKGILVSETIKDSPAEKAGIKRGDVIVELDGKPVEDSGQFRNRIALTAPGTTVRLGIMRKRERINMEVTIGKLDSKAQAEAGMPSKTVPEIQKKLGIEIGEITPEIAQNLNLKDQKGVVVTAVENASPAERAGITPGAVILEVNQKEVKNIAEFQQTMTEAGKEGSVLLLVRERGGTRFVAIKF